MKPNRPLIFIAGAAMDLCWLQAWYSFLLQSIFTYQATINFLLYIFIWGAIVHYIRFSRQRIRILVILVQMIAFSTVFLTAIQLFVLPVNGLKSILNIPRLSSDPHTILDWLLLLLLLIVAGICWQRSRTYIIHPLSLENMYLRFDLGIAAMFVLLVIKLLLAAKFGITSTYPTQEFFFLPLFLFGFLAIGLILNTNHGDRRYTAGLKKIGVAASFSLVVLAAGIGFVALFRSQLTTSAEILSDTLKKAGPPVVGIISWIVRFLWMPRRNPEIPNSSAAGDLSFHQGIQSGSVEPGWLSTVIKWSITVLMVVLFLCFVYWLIRILVSYLFSKTRAVPQSGESIRFLSLLYVLWVKFSRILKLLTILPRRIETAADLYTTLLIWGKKSGIRIKPGETPLEYGNRLVRHFPRLATEISVVIDLIQQEAYREIKLKPGQVSTGKQAKAKMDHPRFWNCRIRTWVISPENQSRMGDHTDSQYDRSELTRSCFKKEL
jgi:hypothetical protein